MDNLNQSEGKERACTTPERMRLVESIKKSIHRSIQKINPADYKNLLKGQYIFMHLCHKGQIINSQYTKVALFLGAIVMKKAVEKVTAIVTNQPNNKMVKKLALMGKPVLSVLWLESCFQEKRKVPYQDFLFQEQNKNNGAQQENQQQLSANFDSLLNLYKNHINVISKQYEQKNKTKFLKFIDKRQKIDRDKAHIIMPHQIDLSIYQAPKRKSQIISDRVPKKRQKKKVQFQSCISQKQPANKFKKLGSQSDKLKQNTQILEQSQNQMENKEETNAGRQESKKESSRLNKNVYEKYLKDFKKYQSTIQDENEKKIYNQQSFSLKLNQNDTPCFISDHQFKQNQNDKKNENATTPIKQKFFQEQLLKTYSVKNQKNKTIKVNIIHPKIGQKITKINSVREEHNLPLIEMCGSDTRNLLWIISKQSKVQTILALLSKPKLILTEQFINLLQKSPETQITQKVLKKYQINCQLNIEEIKGKNVVLLDSVIGCSSLEKIIKQCNGMILNKVDFLFNKVHTDIVVTNRKKGYIKAEKDCFLIMTEADFIDSLLVFQN